MAYRTTISAHELEKGLHNPSWTVVDCRFDLTNPDWGFRTYQQAHIPGAVYAHLDRDLSAPVTSLTGRHPLPDINQITQRLASWGIGNQTQVIVYDTSGGAYAARLWCQLRLLGHEQVAVLDGGLQAWQSAGYPLASGIETREPENFIPHPHPNAVVDAAKVAALSHDPNYCLIDARAPQRYRGEIEPIDPIAGHIPGAVNRFHGDNLSPDGKFLSPDLLREQFQALIGDVAPQNVIVYCGSGVTSCHHLVAMELAGLPGARLYAGSWSEWIRDPSRPIA